MARFPVEVALIGILPRSAPLSANQAATRAMLGFRASGRPGADLIRGFDLADQEDVSDPLPSCRSWMPHGKPASASRSTAARTRDPDGSAAPSSCSARGASVTASGPGRSRPGGAPARARRAARGLPHLEPSHPVGAISEEHPLPLLFRAGVPVSLNSDDPHLMAIDLVHEYELCARLYGFGLEEFAAMNRAALAHSFLDAGAKRRAEARLHG